MSAVPDNPKLGVAILGASGVVGQRFVERLQYHPFFQIRSLVGQTSIGRPYGECASWQADAPLDDRVSAMRVEDVEALRGRSDIGVVFSALPGGVAGPVESELAAAGYKVFTNARDHRMDADVPLLIPEVNPDHLSLVQGKGSGWIVANGNCAAIPFIMALAPLVRAIGVTEAEVTTLQGLSGAGYPGVSALDVVDNVLVHIPGEEAKIETEPLRTLGTLANGRVRDLDLRIRATATRVPVREGHMVLASLQLARETDAEEAARLMRALRGPARLGKAPSAPSRPIVVREEPDRPQPRRDRDAGKGMSVSVGRIRVDGRRLRFIALGHNAVRGAAGQSVLNAEFAMIEGLL